MYRTRLSAVVIVSCIPSVMYQVSGVEEEHPHVGARFLQILLIATRDRVPSRSMQQFLIG